MAFNSISTSNYKNKYDTASSKSLFESASGVLKIIKRISLNSLERWTDDS